MNVNDFLVFADFFPTDCFWMDGSVKKWQSKKQVSEVIDIIEKILKDLNGWQWQIGG